MAEVVASRSRSPFVKLSAPTKRGAARTPRKAGGLQSKSGAADR
jgi:hypothetical protein